MSEKKEQGATKEQGSAASEENQEQSTEQKLLTMIANFLIQWKHFENTGEVSINVTFKEGNVVDANIATYEQMTDKLRSE